MSKRLVGRVTKGRFGLPISPASGCDPERRTVVALAPIHTEALEQIRTLAAEVDESWRGGRGWL